MQVSHKGIRNILLQKSHLHRQTTMKTTNPNAKCGNRVLGINNSHEGRVGTVVAVGPVKCTVSFDDGKPGKFIVHGDYKILNNDVDLKKNQFKMEKDDQRKKKQKDMDIKVVHVSDPNERMKSRVMRLEIRNDMINIATKIAVVTDNENEANQLVAQVMQGINEMTLDIMEQRKSTSG